MNFFTKTQRVTSVAALALALGLTGCSAQSPGSTSETTSASVAAAPILTTSGTPAELASSIADATHYDADDLVWDAAAETTVSLTDGSSAASGTNSDGVSVDGDTVTITAAGDYRVSGKLTDGQLVVAAEDGVVRIILDNVAIASSTGSAVDIKSANEVLLFLEDGTNNALSDASTYSDTGTDAPNAAVYSLADLTVAGTGSLTVNGNYQDGIVSKDGLVLAAGNVTVKAADDGIKGRDYTVLLDGSYSVTAGGDGVKATNDSEADRGWLLLAGGTLSVAAGDDGIKAQTTLTISDGSATVSQSEEGLEAAHIAISGGTINVTSNDDGINAAGGATSADATTSDDAAAGGRPPENMGAERPANMGDAAPGAGGERPTDMGAEPPADMGRGGMGGGMDTVGDFSVDISGGTVTINAEGDGLDSNGDATISGGIVVVNGPTNSGNGALDVNGELTVTGGTLAAAGSEGMVVTPGDSSTQSGVQITLDSVVPAGTALHVTDAAGTVVTTFVTTKQTQSLVLSTPELTDGAEYSVYTGGTADVAAGLGSGITTGATKVSTATAGEYTSGGAPGMR